MPLVLNGATSGSTTVQATDAVTATLTLPSSTGTLLSTANPQSGGVIQVVQASYSTQTSSSSMSYVTSGFSASITPKFATSKILVMVNGGKNYSPANASTYCQMYRNGSTLGLNATWCVSEAGTGVVSSNHSFCYLDSPATTSSVTYTPYYKNGGSAGTVYFCDGPSSAGSINMTLIEVAA